MHDREEEEQRYAPNVDIIEHLQDSRNRVENLKPVVKGKTGICLQAKAHQPLRILSTTHHVQSVYGCAL